MSSILKARLDPPAGRNLGRVLRAFLQRQQGEMVAWMRQLGRSLLDPHVFAPTLDHWTQVMIDAAVPPTIPIFAWGGVQAARRIALVFPGNRVKPKDIFQATHPRVREAVERQTFDFCSATNETSRMELNAALTKLRVELAEGLEAGDATVKLAERVGTIFNSPLRAYTIGRTEASRAVHSGQLQAARNSGVVVGLKWVGKRETCDRCTKLKGKIVPLGQEFAFDPKARPAYQHTYHPPLHPHCTCLTMEVIDPRFLPK